jgi:hypothetical protein
MSTSRFAIVVAILTLTVLPGTSQRTLAGEELASVKGKVTLDGQPLPFGKIIFHLPEGQFVGSKIKADGTFKIDRVLPGTHKVTVEATRKSAAKDKPAVPAVNLIPARYAQEEQSALRVEVKKGRNEYNFDLKSR